MSAEHSLIPHARASCEDPDCEVHNPEMVEDDDARDTAKAYYIAGAYEMASLICDALPNNPSDPSHQELTERVRMAHAEIYDQHSLNDNQFGS